MNANSVVGTLIIAILLGGVISMVAYPIFVEFKPKPVEKKFVKEFSLSEVANVRKVNLNFLVKNGGFNLNFTAKPLIYKFKFTSKKPLSPIVNHTKIGDILNVYVFVNSSDVDIILGSKYVYSGNFTVFLGGGKITFSRYANVENFDFTVNIGGLTVNIFDNPSFNNLNIKILSGGVMLNVKTPALQKNSTVNVEVGNGGIIVQPVTVSNIVGCKIKGYVGVGGITLEPLYFAVVKKTGTECEIKTKNYEEAKTKLDIGLSVGVGGIILNKQFPFKGFPPMFRLT